MFTQTKDQTMFSGPPTPPPGTPPTPTTSVPGPGTAPGEFDPSPLGFLGRNGFTPAALIPVISADSRPIRDAAPRLDYDHDLEAILDAILNKLDRRSLIRDLAVIQETPTTAPPESPRPEAPTPPQSSVPSHVMEMPLPEIEIVVMPRRPSVFDLCKM